MSRDFLRFPVLGTAVLSVVIPVVSSYISELRNQRTIANALVASGVRVGYSDTWSWDNGNPVRKKQSETRGLLGRLFGDDLLFENVVYVNASGMKADDKLFASIARLHGVQAIIASGYSSIQISGEPAINDFPQVTNAGLEHISRLQSLVWLDLRHTKVTDDGLPFLVELKNLRVLDVDQTLVTRKGVNTLSKSLPLCNVNGSP